MSKQNKLIIAAAGSGKTTLLVKSALGMKNQKILITTYTEANEEEIKRRIIKEHGFIPPNIVVQTWFTFLLQHGVRPYQGACNNSLFDKRIHGMQFIQEQSGGRFTAKDGTKVYWGEDDFLRYYFTDNMKIYSDKISKFVVRSNEKSNGRVIERLSRLYSYIYIDEVQDLAGWDLELLILLFKSRINILLVGDPRQVIYLTHQDRKHPGYKDGRIKEFINDKCKNLNCEIDETTLKYSHRNNKKICIFSSFLYPSLPVSEPCSCEPCRAIVTDHEGIFLIQEKDVPKYRATYSPTVLKYKDSISPEWNYGKSKGLGFSRVLIYPTKTIIQYLKDGQLTKTVRGKTTNTFDIAKFYVALTRAEKSVAIVYNYLSNESFIEGIQEWTISA